MIAVWVYRQFAMTIMSLTTGMAEFIFLLLLLWRTIWSLWVAVTGLMPIGVPAIMRWVAFSSRRTVLIIAVTYTGVWIVVVTDLGSEPACGPGHGTHPDVDSIGGLVPHA